MSKNSEEKSNSFKLLVLDEISKDPYFFKRNNLIRYEIPKEGEDLDRSIEAGKVTAVWDLRNEGAFKIERWEQERSEELKFEFYLEILHPGFGEICTKYGLDNKEQNTGPYDKNKGRLILYKNGRTVYTAPTGRKYEGKFSTKTNPYLLLQFLSKELGKVFEVQDLAKCLRNPRVGAEGTTEDRRVRDTVQSIRKKLKLPEGDDFFIVDKGFGLDCDVELKS